MAIDNRYSTKCGDVQDLLTRFMVEDIDQEVVKGAVMLIREARMNLQAENSETKTTINPAVSSIASAKLMTPNGPFPRLIKP